MERTFRNKLYKIDLRLRNTIMQTEIVDLQANKKSAKPTFGTCIKFVSKEEFKGKNKLKI